MSSKEMNVGEVFLTAKKIHEKERNPMTTIYKGIVVVRAMSGGRAGRIGGDDYHLL
jgi:hypothetical protein